MNGTSSLIKKNLELLEQGIPLKEYVEKEEQFLIDGETDVYNEYGLFVIYNNTQKVYLIDGGNRPSAFSMSTSISQFFLTNNGCGNPYMHKHFVDGDKLILKFYQYNPDKFVNMGEFEKFITQKYDEKYENYYDYVLRMNGEPILKWQRPDGYNRYYSGSKPKSTKSLAVKLLRLEHNHPNWYKVLNAIAGILIKPIPLFIWILIESDDLCSGENFIQNGIIFVMCVIGAYLAAIMSYLMFLVIVQFFKLFFCTYKKLVIRVRIFDIIIKLGAKKLSTKEEIELYSEHENNVLSRKNKIEKGKERASERYYKKKKQDLEYAKRELERNQLDYESNVYNAEIMYKSAKEGDGIFQSAESKRRKAGEYVRKSIYNEQDIKRNQRKIEMLERQLGNRK